MPIDNLILVNISGNIDGKVITVKLKRMIRREMTFDTPEDLRRQIEKDRAQII